MDAVLLERGGLDTTGVILGTSHAIIPSKVLLQVYEE